MVARKINVQKNEVFFSEFITLTELHKPQLNLKCRLISCTFQVILSVNQVLIETLI